MSTLAPLENEIWLWFMTNPMISWEKASSSQCGMTHMSSTVASKKGHIFLLTLMGKSWRTLVMGSTSRYFTLKHHQWVTSFSFFVLQPFYHKSKTPSNNNSTHEGSPWEGVVPHLHMHTVCRKYDLATNMLGYKNVIIGGGLWFVVKTLSKTPSSPLHDSLVAQRSQVKKWPLDYLPPDWFLRPFPGVTPIYVPHCDMSVPKPVLASH